MVKGRKKVSSSGNGNTRNDAQGKGKEKEGPFSDTQKRKRANKEIKMLISQFKGRYSLLDCLPVIKRRYPSYVLDVALERVERQRERNELSMERVHEFERFKESLK